MQLRCQVTTSGHVRILSDHCPQSPYPEAPRRKGNLCRSYLGVHRFSFREKRSEITFCFERVTQGYQPCMAFLLWVVAVILAIWGIVDLLQGQILWGIILLVVACAIGPGGWSVWGSR